MSKKKKMIIGGVTLVCFCFLMFLVWKADFSSNEKVTVTVPNIKSEKEFWNGLEEQNIGG